jgi:hypothetical protein
LGFYLDDKDLQKQQMRRCEWSDVMTQKDYYLSLGVSYSTLSSYKSRYQLNTIAEAYEFYTNRKEQRKQKQLELSRIANLLGVKEISVKARMYRRGKFKIDDSLLETKWKNKFEYEGVNAALWRHCKTHDVNEGTVFRYYQMTKDWDKAMDKAKQVRRGYGQRNDLSRKCDELGLNYKRVISCAERRDITKQEAIDYCLKLDEKK